MDASSSQKVGSQPPNKRAKVETSDTVSIGNMREASAGIIAYIREEAPGFSAIIKHRGHDFLVNEIDLEQQVVHLTSLEPPNLSTMSGVGNAEAKADNEAAAPSSVDVYAALAELTDATVAEQVRKMVESQGKEPTEVMTSEVKEKSARVAVHQFFRQHFARELVTDTIEGAIRVRSLHNVKAKDIRGGIRERRGDNTLPVRWEDMPGQYCQFVLYKKGKDTMDAVDYICRTIRVNAKNFTYAGTKDRQAITVQRVTAYRVTAERLAQVNRTNAPVRVGNFTYVKDRLRLGDLAGNRFTIVLRDVKGCSEEEVVTALESLRDHGFINYYGMQRFGTGTVATQKVGAKMLRADWEGAVNLLLSPGEQVEQETARYAQARQHWAEHKDPAAAIKLFPSSCVAERAMLSFFARKESNINDKLGAVMAIPTNMRKLYVHAYQSYIWNCAATERIRRYGLDPVIGDLVIARNEQGELLSDTVDDRIRQVDTVTADNIARYRHEDIVLPLPGYDVKYPSNDIGKFIENIMKEDGLNPYDMKRKVEFTSLPGGYRALFAMPRDLVWKLLRYDDPAAPLVCCDLERLEGREEIQQDKGAYLAIRLEMSLTAGQYATMALRELMHQDTSPAFQLALSREHQRAEQTCSTSVASDCDTTMSQD